MKKFFTILLFGCLGLSAVLMNVACNASSPSTANFQSPLQTIVAINPSWTPTPTFTHTCPPGDTATFTPTGTLTPSSTPTATTTGTLSPTVTPTSCP